MLEQCTLLHTRNSRNNWNNDMYAGFCLRKKVFDIFSNNDVAIDLVKVEAHYYVSRQKILTIT